MDRNQSKFAMADRCEPRNPSYLTQAQTGAVASEDKTCSQLGVSILRDKNGTAVDAAITTTLCIGLLNAFSSGIGGGGFLVLRTPGERGQGVDSRGGEITAIDFRETSPKRSDKWMFGDKKAGRMAAQVGGLSIGTPGELRGLEAAHRLYGSLPWKDLVMPVAELAKGWQISRELARRIRIFGQFMLTSPAWAEVYAPHGYLAVEGEWIKRTKYARTLEIIAKEGVDAFYEGELAQKMVRTIHATGGVLQLDDFSKYKAHVYPAIKQRWGDRTIYTTSAPSSGGVLIALMNLLAPFKIPLTGGLDKPLNVHRFIEALKFAFGARSWITDPAYVSGKDHDRLDEIWTEEWADTIRPKIDDKAHNASYYGIQYDTPADHGTTHLSVVDRWGGVASVTTTINLIWGSHVMCPETGVIMNDELADFAVPGAPDPFGLWPSPWNYPAPGKRPLSSTSPIIILSNDTSLWGTFGGSGGSRIFGSVAQVLLHLDAGFNLSEAIERPRWHNQISPNVTTLEVGPEGRPGRMIEELERRGQSVGVFDLNVGAAEVQAIIVQNGTIWASSDSRKNGIAWGY